MVFFQHLNLRENIFNWVVSFSLSFSEQVVEELGFGHTGLCLDPMPMKQSSGLAFLVPTRQL